MASFEYVYDKNGLPYSPSHVTPYQTFSSEQKSSSSDVSEHHSQTGPSKPPIDDISDLIDQMELEEPVKKKKVVRKKKLKPEIKQKAGVKFTDWSNAYVVVVDKPEKRPSLRQPTRELQVDYETSSVSSSASRRSTSSTKTAVVPQKDTLTEFWDNYKFYIVSAGGIFLMFLGAQVMTSPPPPIAPRFSVPGGKK
jgi:hypothetical protein